MKTIILVICVLMASGDRQSCSEYRFDTWQACTRAAAEARSWDRWVTSADRLFDNRVEKSLVYCTEKVEAQT